MNSTSSNGWPNNEHAPLDLLYAKRGGIGWQTGRHLQQRHLARSAFVDRLTGFLGGPVPPSCGLRMPVWHFNFGDLLILTCPVGPEYIGGEHDTRRNLNKLAHRQVFLSGLNVEVRSGVARAAVPHFDPVTRERSPSIFHDHLCTRKYVAMSVCRCRDDRTLPTRCPVLPVGQRRDIGIKCQLGSLFDQKATAILGLRNPMRRFTAAAPRRAGLRITILRRNRGTRARCNGATSTEKLFGRDPVFGNLFADGGNDGVQLCKPRFFRLLCQRIGLRLQFEIGSHKCAGMSS